ncbi:sensor histidine kinase [Ramlibacter sp. PS4R-6]|uniref:sensor histidine kinase n=1 Tax=Ramlibacter sp. PS4R-6 TaxID=3133438 RepID=UPI0030B7E389
MAPDPDPKRGLREWRSAALAGIAFVSIIAIVAALALQRERRLLIEQARKDATTLAALFEENTARTFDGVASTLEGLAIYTAAMQPPKNDRAARETMRARLGFVPTVRALFVIGPDGFILHDTDYPNTPAVSLADRPYFRQYLDDERVTRAVSEALQSRSGTGWFVAVTRRITARDGRFLGVAVAAVQLDSISRLYRKLDLQPGQQVSLLQGNGTLLARYPADDALIGRSFAEAPVFATKLLQRRADTFVTSGPPWGYERIVSYRAVEGHPLVVLVSTRIEVVLATWNRAVVASIAGLLALSLLTAGAVRFFVLGQRARGRAQAHRNAEEAAVAVAQANAKFRAFFEQGSMFACVISPDGDLLEVNHGQGEAGGQPLPAGTKLWECPWFAAPESQQSVLREGIALARAGETFRCEAAFRGDSRLRLIDLVLSPVRDEAGAILAIAGAGVDVTERKHQEEQLRVLARDLADVDRRRAEFLATLSHELRNVLTPVQNCAQILKIAEPGSTQAARAREVLSQQLRQMKRLIDDLLDVSRINSGKVQLELEGIDLRTVLLRAADATQSSMERASHKFELALPADELLMSGDPARLEQVFTNLLGNAAKYTPLGGNIRLAARSEGHEAVVEIRDDGLGIPVTAQARIFEMFEQVGSHADQRQGGLGIGLGLVSKLVALHGGHVEVFSDGPGHGSTFTVYLPLTSAPTPRPVAPDAGADGARSSAPRA